MIRSRNLTATLVAAGLALAGFALGQNADKNSAGPTKNDYRLRVVQPAEGATITTPSMQVVVDLRTIPEVGGEKRDVNSMPRPRVDIFLDNENKGTLQEGQNVMTLDAVGAGAHKLVVLAKNQSNEVIDRKEINFTSEPGTSVATTSVETHRAPAATGTESTMSTETQASAPAPAPAPPARVEAAPAPPPPPAPRVQAQTAPPPAPSSSMTREETHTSRNLPSTASSVPLVGVAGLGLLVTGLALRRRV
jgi:hypothetical protein